MSRRQKKGAETGFTKNQKWNSSNEIMLIMIEIRKDKIETSTHRTKKHDFTYLSNLLGMTTL